MISLRLLRRLAVTVGIFMGLSPASFGQLYQQNFNADSTASWTVNNPMLSDILVDFHYDYSLIGVPVAPSGLGTRGLKMTANNANGVFSGFSVSPTGQNFTGNYRVSFDLWQNYVGPLGPGGSGSTQLSTFGVGTAGNVAIWAGSMPKESVMFAVTLDGGSASDFRAFSSAAPTSYPAGDSVYASASLNNTDPYYAGFAAESAPPVQVLLYPGQTGTTDAGEPAFKWRRVVIQVANGTADWYIDGLFIASVPLAGLTLGGNNILFGHSDTNAGSSADPNDTLLNVTIIDNVVVEQLFDRPTLKVKGAKKLTTTRSRVRLRGVTSEDANTLRYTIRSSGRGSKKRQVKLKSDRWKVTIPVKPGLNRIKLVAEGPGGSSKPQKVKVLRSEG